MHATSRMFFFFVEQMLYHRRTRVAENENPPKNVFDVDAVDIILCDCDMSKLPKTEKHFISFYYDSSQEISPKSASPSETKVLSK
jgi:hypothetical protein